MSVTKCARENECNQVAIAFLVLYLISLGGSKVDYG